MEPLAATLAREQTFLWREFLQKYKIKQTCHSLRFCSRRSDFFCESYCNSDVLNLNSDFFFFSGNLIYKSDASLGNSNFFLHIQIFPDMHSDFVSDRSGRF